MYKILIFLSFLSFISCNKDEKIFIPDQTFNINQEVLLRQLIETPHSYKINITDEDYLFFGPNGNILEIPKNSILDNNGQPVHGEIKFDFLEFSQNRSSFLFAPSTGYQNTSFDAKKLAFIRFSKDDKELLYKEGVSLYFPQEKSPDRNNNKLLIANKDQIEKIGWSTKEFTSPYLDIFDWLISYKDNIVQGSGYKIDLVPNHHWYSIGSFVESKFNQNVNLCVEVDKEFNARNTLVYFLASKTNTSIKLIQNIGENLNFCQKNMVLPNAIDGHFIVISENGNESYFFGMTNAVINADTHIKVNSEKKTLKEIREILSSL